MRRWMFCCLLLLAPVLPSESSWAEPGPELPPLPPEIRVATWNIQVLGVAKMSRPEVVGVIADTIREFDIVAIQELRARNYQDVVGQLLDAVNSPYAEPFYVASVGERLGRSQSKEQYVYVYDTRTIDGAEFYTLPDPEDFFHRPPRIGTFRARGPPESECLDFTLICIHSDPNDAQEEMDALLDAYASIDSPGCKILLGDFNVPPGRYLDRAHELGLTPVSRELTNTRLTAAYDNILVPACAPWTHAGVWDYRGRNKLTLEEALAVSDHKPVWVSLSTLPFPEQSAPPSCTERFMIAPPTSPDVSGPLLEALKHVQGFAGLAREPCGQWVCYMRGPAADLCQIRQVFVEQGEQQFVVREGEPPISFRWSVCQENVKE